MTPHKKRFFCSNLYKIEVIIISIMKMLEFTNFGHITTAKIQLELRDKVLLVTLWTKIMIMT